MSEYTTLPQVHLRMPELGTDDDQLLSDMIRAVSAYFDSETENRFDNETKLQLFSGNGTKQLFIHPALASAPTLVRIRDNALGAWRTVPTADVRLMPEGRRNGDPIRWLELLDTPSGPDTIWPKADDTAEITGPWGRTAVPDDIAEACLQTVVNLYRARGSAGTDVEPAFSGGAYMSAIPKAMPHFAWAVLQNYKRLVFA